MKELEKSLKEIEGEKVFNQICRLGAKNHGKKFLTENETLRRHKRTPARTCNRRLKQ